MKILLAPDKFKGSLTADEVCFFIKKGLSQTYPEAEIIAHPMADGGEGSLDIIKSNLNTETVSLEAQDPLFRNIKASYEFKDAVAYVEMSRVSGLALLKEEERNPLHTSTIGTGQLIRHAVEQGARKVFLFIGGSATNDGGTGMASALGYRFLDGEGKEVKPTGENLAYIHQIDASEVIQELKQVSFEVVCDVKNKLCGPQGATYVYGPQKGAHTQAVLDQLENGMNHFQLILGQTSAKNFADMEGGGAAGGLGAGAVAFLNAQIRPGTESLMAITRLSQHLEGLDLIVTGEGKSDEQTLQGKVIDGVATLARRNNIPFGIICGVAEQEERLRAELKPAFLLQVTAVSKNVPDAIQQAGKYVEQLAKSIKIT